MRRAKAMAGGPTLFDAPALSGLIEAHERALLDWARSRPLDGDGDDDRFTACRSTERRVVKAMRVRRVMSFRHGSREWSVDERGRLRDRAVSGKGETDHVR